MIMANPHSTVISRETGEILQRLFYLRNRFKVAMPENINLLRARLDKSNLGDKGEGITDFDLSIKLAGPGQRAGAVSMGRSAGRWRWLSTATRLMDWLVKNDMLAPLTRRPAHGPDRGGGERLYQTINGYLLERSNG
jgi:hypothetical protein